MYYYYVTHGELVPGELVVGPLRDDVDQLAESLRVVEQPVEDESLGVAHTEDARPLDLGARVHRLRGVHLVQEEAQFQISAAGRGDIKKNRSLNGIL